MDKLTYPRALVLATSYAPELRGIDKRPAEYPRTDYVELAKVMGCDIIDYSIYDKSAVMSAYRNYEKKLRLDFHLALTGYKRARNYDVVMLMSEAVAIPYMMLQKVIGKRGKVAFVSAHSSDQQAKLVKPLGLFTGIDVVSMYANAQREFMACRMGVPEERIRTVLYSVDEAFYAPGSNSGEYVFTSGISYRDYDTFFEAVKGLPVKVKVAAGGRLYCPRSKVPLPEPPENVELMPRMDSAGMRELHRNAAVVVASMQPGRSDAAGCTLVLEGMCCGRAVVASRTSAMRDYIRDGETGLLVEPGNPEAMREAIRELLASIDLRHRLGTNARSACEGEFSLGRLVNGHAESIMIAAGKDRVTL